MKVQQDTMNNFFSITNTRFTIPVYQRNYAWEKENCAKILEDIVSIARDINKTHFMGTITFIIHLVPEENTLRNTQEYMIIDGQQRITTLMLLLKALQQKTRDEQIRQEIARFLSDNNTTTRLRLKPIKRDKEAYSLVMDNRWNECNGNSKIKTNYHFFIKELDEYVKQGYGIEEIYSAFLRLKIVGIGLEKDDDDPQVVFESINATGVRLEGVDLIRNYLMMGEDSQRQQNLYETYWIPLEEYLIKESVISTFIEHYLRIYYGVDVRQDEIYKLFKKHSKEHFGGNLEGLMQEIRDYSSLYRIFVDDTFSLQQPNATDRELIILRKYIQIIVELKFGVSYPFVLRLAHDFVNDKLDYENFKAMLEILISYYVRRMICGEASNALNKVVYALYNHLKDTDSINVKGLMQFLGTKNGREIFPSNVQLKRYFETTNAYSLRACKLIFLEIEKTMNAEPPREEKLEVEHFYPQTPDKEGRWRNLVGGEYIELEGSYLNTFGNLSLTGQNSKLSNKPFEEKIELLLENGSLKLNEYFTNMSSWGIEHIKARSAYLADKFCAIEIFRDLPQEYRVKSLARNLADDLTYYHFRFMNCPNGDIKEVSNAKEVAKAVIEYMYEYHRDAVENALNENLKYIAFDENIAKSRDVAGSLSIEYEKGKFYFISSASMRDVGKNLAHFVKSAGISPEGFILEN